MIVILSDFGNSEYLGIMKGVIYSIYNKAKIVDLYNNINPHNIKEAAWILLNSYKYFPKNTIFLCVVDPGVGSKRNCLAIKTKNYYFIGPDNGLLYPTIKQNKTQKIIKLSTKGASKTFHGRDVFAKAAAKLEKGTKIEKLGKIINKNKLKKLEFHLNKRRGEIVRIDNFGNIITNLKSLNKKQYYIKIKKIYKKLNFYNTYEEAPENTLFLIGGSSKTLEISIKNKKAIDKLKVEIGNSIEIK